jgi:hypothetical protein
MIYNSFTSEVAAEAVRSAETVANSAAETLSGDEARAIATQMVTQDPTWRSWRVWAAIWGGLATILSLPEVQAVIQTILGTLVPVEYLPFLPGFVGAVSAVISKLLDKRPVTIEG